MYNLSRLQNPIKAQIILEKEIEYTRRFIRGGDAFFFFFSNKSGL